MKLSYYPEVDAAYLDLSTNDVLESEEVQPGIIFDFDANGEVVGIEILRVRQRQAAATTVEVALESRTRGKAA